MYLFQRLRSTRILILIQPTHLGFLHKHFDLLLQIRHFRPEHTQHFRPKSPGHQDPGTLREVEIQDRGVQSEGTHEFAVDHIEDANGLVNGGSEQQVLVIRGSDRQQHLPVLTIKFPFNFFAHDVDLG
jgi:hypothetical protein